MKVVRETQHLKFFKTQNNHYERPLYMVLNVHTHEPLGKIKYYPDWNEYTFFPIDGTMYSSGCMMSIRNFIKEVENGEGK